MTDTDSGKRLSDADIAEMCSFAKSLDGSYWINIDKDRLLKNHLALLSHIASLTPTSGGNVEERAARELAKHLAQNKAKIECDDPVVEQIHADANWPSLLPIAREYVAVITQSLRTLPVSADGRDAVIEAAATMVLGCIDHDHCRCDACNALRQAAATVRTLKSNQPSDTPEAFGVQPRSHRLSQQPYDKEGGE